MAPKLKSRAGIALFVWTAFIAFVFAGALIIQQEEPHTHHRALLEAEVIHVYPSDICDPSKEVNYLILGIQAEVSRENGGFVLPAIGIGLCVWGAINVRDGFLIPTIATLNRILRMEGDLAAVSTRTLGSLMVEWQTCAVALFFARSQMGTTLVLGSMAFSNLFIVGVYAVVAPIQFELRSRGIIKTAICLLVGMGLLFVFSSNGVIEWYEAWALVLVYAVYVWAVSHSYTIYGWSCIRMILREKLDYAIQLPSEEKVLQTDTMAWPSETKKQVIYIASFLVRAPIYYTCPSVQSQEKYGLVLLALAVCLLWGATYVYIYTSYMVIFCRSIGISSSIAMLFVIAPVIRFRDLLGFYARAREADQNINPLLEHMAAYITGITAFLGIPWFVWLTIFRCGLIFSDPMIPWLLLVLMGCVCFSILGVVIMGWMLRRELGIIVITLYMLVLAMALLVETNIVPALFTIDPHP